MSDQRIEKLLNLAKNNPNSAEAQSALNKAHELIQKKSKKTQKGQTPLLKVVDNGESKRQRSSLFSKIQFIREPTVTYCVTPNNAPEPTQSKSQTRYGYVPHQPTKEEENLSAQYILDTLASLQNEMKFADRVRFGNGIKFKLSDTMSFTIAVENRTLKFYVTVPKKMSKAFVNAIKLDWGQVDITRVHDKFIDIDAGKSKAMEVALKYHYGLSIMVDKKQDPFYQNIGAVASQMLEDEKLVIKNIIKPVAEQDWKGDSKDGYKKFQGGVIPQKKEWSVDGFIDRALNVFDKVLQEVLDVIEAIMGSETEAPKAEKPWEDKYSKEKQYEGVKGFQDEIYVVAQSNDSRRPKHLLKAVQTAYEAISGDNRFVFRHKSTDKGVKVAIERIQENKPKMVAKGGDIYSLKEIAQMMHVPNAKILKEFKDVIEQDGFTRVAIHQDFLDPNGMAFAQTLGKQPQTIHLGECERDWWTPKGRKAHSKQKLDDRSQAWMMFGMQGSGKTSLITRMIADTFGVHLKPEEWKYKSKSVVAFDVADGDIIAKVWNLVPPWLRHRVIILNHSVPERPVPINFADLEEFNRKVMNDPDFAHTLASMEASLIKEIIEAGQSIYVDRWFPIALQCAHIASQDFGIPEALRLLVDDEFRLNEIMPELEKSKSHKRLLIEMNKYNKLVEGNKADEIVTAIQNRLTQLEADPKLWDCMAQRPLRDEQGNCTMNMRKWIDGDEDGAYLVLVYIPKTGVSETFRKFVFAHYMTKVWNAVVSREKGFAGREYRPECMIVVDEIHQILNVPMIGRMFIDMFKEPRKYSARYVLSLHGWSSIAKAGRSIESDIKQSILDNGCNFVMLKGGEDAFDSLSNFFQGMNVADYNNLMNMPFCGIFSVRWNNQTHVFQAKLLPEAHKSFKVHDKWDLNDLAKYRSPFSRDRDQVRDENLERIKSMLEADDEQDGKQGGASQWDKEALRKAGSRERSNRKSL